MSVDAIEHSPANPLGTRVAAEAPWHASWFQQGMRSTRPTSTVRAPITGAELLGCSHDTVFLVTELADAIRRGVTYFSLKGRVLVDLDAVILALVNDGEIVFEDDGAEEPVRH